jgi:hypothetical protein
MIAQDDGKGEAGHDFLRRSANAASWRPTRLNIGQRPGHAYHTQVSEPQPRTQTCACRRSTDPLATKCEFEARNVLRPCVGVVSGGHARRPVIRRFVLSSRGCDFLSRSPRYICRMSMKPALAIDRRTLLGAGLTAALGPVASAKELTLNESPKHFWPNGARLALSFSLMFEAGGQPISGARGVIHDPIEEGLEQIALSTSRKAFVLANVSRKSMRS